MEPVILDPDSPKPPEPSSGKNDYTGVSTLSLLTLMFVGLRLGGVIHWSWWWVLAPLWGPASIVTAVALCAFVWSYLRSPR